MASRLSQETTIRAYDGGHVPMTRDHSIDLMTGPPVDLDAALCAKNPKKAIAAIPPQPLYFALMHRGLEDSLDVLDLVSRAQFIKLMDYTAWREDRLSAHRVFDWLGLYANLGRQQVYERFRQLDEEYQLAVVGPYIELIDEEEYEMLKDHERDDLTALPCNTLHYRIKTNDQKMRMAIEDLIASTLEGDIAYAYSLLSHAAYMPPGEQEALIAQFRKARLEEDGFVTQEESLRLFRPLDLESLATKWTRESVVSGLVVASGGGRGDMLARVLERGVATWDVTTYEAITRGFLAVANGMCAATHTEPDDEQGLRRILTHTQAMISLALESLISDDVDLGVSIVAAEHPQTLFRAGLSQIHKLQSKVVAAYEAYDLPKAELVRKHWRLDQRGLLMTLWDEQLTGLLDLRTLETLKGLFNRFPVSPKTTLSREDGTERIVFAPIASLATLGVVSAEMDRLFGLVHLASCAREGDWRNLEEVLSTGLARVAIGQEFRDLPLTSDMMQSCLQLDREEYDRVLQDFYHAAEKMLRLSGQDDNHWAISGASASVSPIQSAMAAFSDVLMEFSLNRERTRERQFSRIPAVAVEDGSHEEAK